MLEQAKRYARGAFGGPGNWSGYRVPFLYATNGEVIHFIDVRDERNLSRLLADFHTGDALSELYGTDRTTALKWLETNPVDIPGLRAYQVEAIQATEGALIAGRRTMLIAMATGTGKTYTTVSQVYRLLKSKAAKRILFLVDRRALAAQAVRTFSAFQTPSGNKFTQEYDVFSQRFQREDFEEDDKFDPTVLPSSYLTNPQSTHTFVYVSTIQRMTINLFGWESAFPSEGGDPDDESDAGKLNIPIHAFDVIIADECHRGYTAKEMSIWRGVLEYFDAVKIGLTATPAVHTTAFFKNVVCRYTTDQAVEDGYLVDYEAVGIRSDVRIKGAFLKEGEQVGIVDTRTGVVTYDVLEDEREFSSSDIEEKITAPRSNEKIIREIAGYALEHERRTGRFPKTLIFAVNDLPHTSHADQVVRVCREVFNRGDDFVQKITGSPSVDRPLQRIREFRNRPNPKIVVTVDVRFNTQSPDSLSAIRANRGRAWTRLIYRTGSCPCIAKPFRKGNIRW